MRNQKPKQRRKNICVKTDTNIKIKFFKERERKWERGREGGRKEGRKEGRKKGRKEGRKEIIKHMISLGKYSSSK